MYFANEFEQYFSCFSNILRVQNGHQFPYWLTFAAAADKTCAGSPEGQPIQHRL